MTESATAAPAAPAPAAPAPAHQPPPHNHVARTHVTTMHGGAVLQPDVPHSTGAVHGSNRSTYTTLHGGHVNVSPKMAPARGPGKVERGYRVTNLHGGVVNHGTGALTQSIFSGFGAAERGSLRSQSEAPKSSAGMSYQTPNVDCNHGHNMDFPKRGL